MKLPLIGLGTWELRGAECTRVVLEALEMGYRHIDTAHYYENHTAIGKAMESFDRKELFITSKLFLDQVNLDHIEGSVERECDLALKELGTEYLDLYLIHWPVPSIPQSKVLFAMEKLIGKGKIRQVGVSNFTIRHLQEVFQDGCRAAVNQVEFHPFLYQKELLDFCRSKDVQLMAYRPFGKGELLKEPIFQQIGEKHGKTGSQVILRWMVQKEISVIPKASSKTHLKQNLEIFDFSLTKAEMEKIDGLNRNLRYCEPDDPTFKY